MSATILASIATVSSTPAGEIIQATWPMATSPGAVSVPGLKAGDVMLTLVRTDLNTSFVGQNYYEGVVSADDEIEQRVSNTPGGYPFSALFFRAA